MAWKRTTPYGSYMTTNPKRQKYGRYNGTSRAHPRFNPYQRKYVVPRTTGWAGAKTEHKYYDSFLSAAALTSATGWLGTEFDPATDNTLFVPVEGNDINNRVGRKVTARSLRIRGTINVGKQANQVNTDAACQVRMILVQDMQTNAAQMQGEDLQALPGAATGLLAVNTFQSLNNLGRFKVLKDKTFWMGNPNAVWDGTNIEQQVTFRFGLIQPILICRASYAPSRLAISSRKAAR